MIWRRLRGRIPKVLLRVIIDEYHTEVGSNLYHICEFAERMERNGHAYEPKTEDVKQQRAVKHKEHER